MIPPLLISSFPLILLDLKKVLLYHPPTDFKLVKRHALYFIKTVEAVNNNCDCR